LCSWVTLILSKIFGYESFADAAKLADVDGILTVDLPPEEASEYGSLLKARAIDPIFLLAPNSTDDRIKKMDVLGSGYLYYVSLKGVTGAGHLNIAAVEAKLQPPPSQYPVTCGHRFWR